MRSILTTPQVKGGRGVRRSIQRDVKTDAARNNWTLPAILGGVAVPGLSPFFSLRLTPSAEAEGFGVRRQA